MNAKHFQSAFISLAQLSATFSVIILLAIIPLLLNESSNSNYDTLIIILWSSSLIFAMATFLFIDFFLDNKLKEDNSSSLNFFFFPIWIIILLVFSFSGYHFFQLEFIYIFIIDLFIMIFITILSLANSLKLDDRIKHFEFIFFLFGWIFFVIGLAYVGYCYINVPHYIIAILGLFLFIELMKITTNKIGNIH